jgi:hypothetical protein
MLLLCVILALVTIGFVVPCVLDIATTPGRYFDLPSKQTWLVVAIGFWAFGAAAWLIAGRVEVQQRRRWDYQIDRWMAANSYPPGHPAGLSGGYPAAGQGHRAMAARTRFVAPDDNPEFLVELDYRIRGWREGV